MADNRKLYKEAVKTFGHASQIDMMIEECAELIFAIQKHKRVLPCDVPGEIADVEIMCAQMRIIFPGVADAKKRKLERLYFLIEERKDVVKNRGEG